MKIIAGNWKMNHSFDAIDEWLEDFFSSYTKNLDNLKDVEMVICPPNLFLDYIDSELMSDSIEFLETIMKKESKQIDDFEEEEINKIIESSKVFKLGAQDCHYESKGAFTGDVSAEMLSTVGCSYVILGHSERRDYHKETNEIVAKKAKSALEKKLTPIICVGESKEIRQEGKHLEFIKKQIIESTANNNFEKLVIAYEPIWSIGTGEVPDVKQILEVANFVKEIFANDLKDKAKEYYLLYGGSVKSSNSKEILSVIGIDGLLVGGASLNAEEFIKICCY